MEQFETLLRGWRLPDRRIECLHRATAARVAGSVLPLHPRTAAKRRTKRSLPRVGNVQRAVRPAPVLC